MPEQTEDNGNGEKAPVTEEKQEKENPGKKVMDEILGRDKKGNKPPRKSFL